MNAALAFGTPRKLPKAKKLAGRVVVLDIAFAGASPSGGFDKVTRPLIDDLGVRLAAWVDHHDHEEHARFARDPRFVLSTKAQHPACPEMVTPELVARIGAIDTVLCHTDFDGLASAAKWLRGGHEPYPGCDADARAIDTRLGEPSPLAAGIDRALRARPRDEALFANIVEYLVGGVVDGGLARSIEAAAAELLPIERESERAARAYVVTAADVAIVDISVGYEAVDKTWLLLLGQRRATTSVVIDRDSIAVAAGFDSGKNFLELFELAGGMPTRVSLPRSKLRWLLTRLGVAGAELERFS